ncbi:unnamed protein product, partial [Polarella glacialis]
MARPYRRLIALLLAGVAAAPLNLTILHMNDHHSHLSGETISLKQTSSMNVTGVQDIKITLGGFPRIVTAYNRLKAEAEVAGRTVLKLHAGDALTGTSFYTLFKGEADAKMMAMVCFDAFALGNHEFDDGDSALAGFIQKLKTSNSSCPNTAVLAANVVPGASSPLIGKIQKSTTLTVNGEKIGIIGIDIMGKTMMSSSPSAGTILTDEKAAAQTEINTLLAAGVNKIILLTHIGYDLDQEWIAGLSGVDAVVGADSHTLLGDSSTTTAGLSIGGLYPTVMTNGDGKKVCVTTAWEYTKAIGNLEIDFDANGDVLSCGGSPKFPYDGTSMVADSALSADDLTLVNNHLDSLGGQFIATSQDSATLTLLTNYSGQVDALKKLKIADVPVTLCYDRFPGEGRSTACPKNATEKQGGAACQLVAQAFLYVSKTADFAIQNGGGCRSDIVAGNLSYNGAITMLPFANLIVTLKMTGAQVKQVLEEALDYGLSAGGSSGAYPYASGLRFDVNCNMSKGSRFSNMEVNSRLTGTWTAIDPLKNYTLGTNSYTAAGKDGYVSFASVQASLVNLQIDYAEGLVTYAKAVGTLTIPPLRDHQLEADEQHECHGCQGYQITLGGFPRIVTAYNRLKAEAEVAGRTVLKLHAGDALTGTSFYTLFKGEADAKMMAMVCFDAFALGNHEFDDGDSALAGFIQKLKTSNSSCPNTAVLAANVVPGASSPLIGKIQKSTTLTVNGEKIGIIGIDIMGKTMMSSSPSAGTILTDEKAAAQTEINTLLAAGVNKIILLTHIGYDLDQEWMAGLSGVDAVVGADSHTLLGDSSTTTAGLSIGGLYPTVMTNGDGKKVCVTTAWEYTKAIGNLEIDFDANGDVLSCGGSPKFPYDGTSMVADSALSADDLTLVNNHLNSLGGQFIATAQDSATLTLLTNYSGQVDALKKLKIADVPVTLCYDRFPGEGRSTACPKNATEKQGGAACQLVAQAFLYVSKTADFAIQNGGGCRSDIVAGNLSYNGAITMLPFANLIVTLKMTGAQVKQVLEEALDYGLSAGGSSGAYPYASGL